MNPRATYRLQFSKEFGFEQAAKLAPYLKRLGISHVYASPYLQARPGSKHGYDITDHNALNLELGDVASFGRMLEAFRANGLEHILDYVPNHMGVGGADNPLWLSVLEWGQESPYAEWFDIDWDSHTESLNGKLLVPFLGEPYGAALESGKVELQFDAAAGEFSVFLYGVHELPVSPLTYPRILRNKTLELERLSDEFSALREARADILRTAPELKARLAELAARDPESRAAIDASVASFRGRIGDLDSWMPLDSLIGEQPWRPTYFRVAADDINYRRFFNISDLAGIRMELPEVFDHTHELVLRMIAEGNLQGLRIDHIDGLFHPKAYLDRLRSKAGNAFYLVVEKILAAHESLRDDWPVAGTTGYEFCAQSTALLVNPAAEKTLTEFYREFTGETETFAQIVRESKFKIMENEMASELESLSRDAVRIARQSPRTTDFTRNILLRALKEVIACFPVYRTYVDGATPSEADDRYIHWAVAQAIRNEQEVDRSVFEFVESILTGRLAEQAGSGYSRHSVIGFAMRAQQVTGPVMAKGLEDTAFYRYNRLIALNEVGSAPEQFGLPVSAFHKENQHRADKWPQTMLSTSTHDVKRGEDARARLATLSLVPEEWKAKVATWSRILRARRGDVEGTAPPARNDEYLFYQNLIGTWPAELTLPRKLDAAPLGNYTKRIESAMTKSLREARVRSNWTAPDASYEEAMTQFVRDALDPKVSETFLENFRPFQRQVAEMGVRHSLVQLLLKATSPGVPDFYQGSELWNLSLPDPDNRRPVNFEAREELLSKIAAALESGDRIAVLRELLNEWHDGGIKLAITQLLLRCRATNRRLFEGGSYTPLASETEGLRVCAYSRGNGADSCVVIASLDAGLGGAAGEQALDVSELSSATAGWRDEFTGRVIRLEHGRLSIAEVLEVLPIALLLPA